jgi:L-fuconolactonase
MKGAPSEQRKTIPSAISAPVPRRCKRRLASFDNVSCKISGLVTETKWNSWEEQDFEPYLDVVFSAFGPPRLMIGSDWPVCTLAADCTSVIHLETGYIARLSGDEQRAILEKNPIEF